MTEPVFSPDGQSIAFYTDRALKRIAVTGGAAVTIVPADAPYGISWGEDGIVFGQGGKGILRVSPDGGTPETLVRVEDGEEAHGPQILPGGQHVLFTLATGTARDRWDRGRIVVQSLASGVRTPLVDGGSDARYLATGHIVYALSGVLYAVPFDTQRLALTGAAVPIVEGVSRATGKSDRCRALRRLGDGLAHLYSWSPRRIGWPRRNHAVGIDRSQGSHRAIAPPAGVRIRCLVCLPTAPASPSGPTMARRRSSGFITLLGKAPRRRLTFGGNNRFPIWSADGKRIVFQSDRAGDAGMFWQPADGSGTAERLTTPRKGTSHVPESWSPHGDRLSTASRRRATSRCGCYRCKIGRRRHSERFTRRRPLPPRSLADGRWVAYASTDRGKQTVYVQPFPATGAKYQLVAKGLDTPSHPVWSPDGQRTFLQPETAGPRGCQASRPRRRFAFGNSDPVPRPFQLTPPEQRRAYDITPGGRFVARIAAARTQDTMHKLRTFRSSSTGSKNCGPCADHPIADNCAVDASSAILFRERSKAVGV